MMDDYPYNHTPKLIMDERIIEINHTIRVTEVYIVELHNLIMN